MKNSSLHFLWREADTPSRFHSAVSLHAHSRHSREVMLFLGSYQHDFPVLGRLLTYLERQYSRAVGQPFSLSRIVWNPPPSAHEVVATETEQIHGLGLRALVSLTDHDRIDGGLALHADGGAEAVPLSLEWTVPYGPTLLHLGVHNLATDTAQGIACQLEAYAQNPSPERLHEFLTLLNQQPDLLVVLNHPLWDGLNIGRERHREALQSMLGRHGGSLHALEVNGYRSWSENQGVLALAEEWGMPVVSGGDRHGFEPNAILNLTRAETFAEFVAEVRYDGRSEVVFLPQYREPLRLRCLEAAWDLFRTGPSPSGPAGGWKDRFFFEGEDGIMRPLSSFSRNAGPAVLKPLFAALRLSLSHPVRPALRWMLADPSGLRG